MKRFFSLLGIFCILLSGCVGQPQPAQIAATTLPVYEFTTRLCDGTGITVTRLIHDNVSCLHDYSLSVSQVKAAESAELIVLSGAGLEDFMEDLLDGRNTLDASRDIALLESDVHDHHHDEDAHHHHAHDPHLWLSPEYAKSMCQNICDGLSEEYPAHRDIFHKNLQALLADLEALQVYGEAQLSDLSCRELVTFHDGFSYFADAFSLTILKAVEEESGSEASAAELKEMITLVLDHDLPAIFTEKNGSVSAAGILEAETGTVAYGLDMAMSGSSWFDAMYHNIDVVKEALG